MEILLLCDCGKELDEGVCKVCEKECPDCLSYYSRDDFVTGLDREERCPDCDKDAHTKCIDCECRILTDTHRCEDCENSYMTCSSCDCEFHEDSYARCDFEGEEFCCKECLESEYPMCECGERHCDGEKCPEIHPRLPSFYQECYLPNRVFSIELETDVEVECPYGWDMVDDNSISGGEYLTGPILGQRGIDKITSGCPELSNPNTSSGINVSYKTGYHLHINARDKDDKAIAKFGRFCFEYQDDFFKMVPKSRRKTREDNGYCCLLDGQFKDCRSTNIETIVYKSERKNVKSKYNNARYHWVNFHSYYFRQTIEIRLHSGTTVAEKVLRWAELWLRLFEYVTNECTTEFSRDNLSVWEVMRKVGVRESTVEFYKVRVAKFSDKNGEE